MTLQARSRDDIATSILNLRCSFARSSAKTVVASSAPVATTPQRTGTMPAMRRSQACPCQWLSHWHEHIVAPLVAATCPEEDATSRQTKVDVRVDVVDVVEVALVDVDVVRVDVDVVIVDVDAVVVDVVVADVVRTDVVRVVVRADVRGPWGKPTTAMDVDLSPAPP